MRETRLEKGFRFVTVLVHCCVSKKGNDHVSFSSLILSLCGVYGRKRPVWSCGVVEWIGRPLISSTPSPGHRQLTTLKLKKKAKIQLVKIPAVASASVLHSAVFGGSVVGVVGPL